MGLNKTRSLTSLAAGLFNERADSSKFVVVFDDGDYDLGSWAKVSGLGVSWEACEYRSGSHREIWHAPGIPKYSKITLSRSVCPDSETVQEWLSKTQRKPKPFSGSIELLSSIGLPLVEWELETFFPTGWKITDLDSMAANVVMETLEITHTGFLEGQGKKAKRPKKRK